jgi:CIC family chloride channel protein
VVFVAETTGGHSFIIPSLIGAACAYAISGEASASGDQRLHEIVKLYGFTGVSVRELMRTDVTSVQASATVQDFADSIAQQHDHVVYPVIDNARVIGTVSVTMLGRIAPAEWTATRIGDVADDNVSTIAVDADLTEAYRLLLRENSQRVLFVMSDGRLEGIVTGTDILLSLQAREGRPGRPPVGSNHQDYQESDRRHSRPLR